MDQPLLALTRRRSGDPLLEASPDTMADNMRQLVQLRWLALAGQLVTILIVGVGFDMPLPLSDMLGLVAALAVANFATLWFLPRHRVTSAEIAVALLFDMAVLAGQLYLSGGTSNPFSLLFLVQVVLGAILLESIGVWLLAVVAVLSYAGLSLKHLPLRFAPGLQGEVADLYTLGSWLGFALATVLLILFIGRISRNLRARDAHLFELRQRAAEEDGIVRMGLFASGAAHVLGTPLATLSVILGDWQRMPVIARNNTLSEELAEMRSEVERCKSIVSDILHLAGEPRGEAMASMEAAQALSEIAADWRRTHPQADLVLDVKGAGKACIIAEPALRQAIWSLLDNAAEASPSVRLSAQASDSTLTISVRDLGDGFRPAQLEALGKPMRSTKGDGHGLGLFLATNVARRLGGRLTATNLAQGAEVAIELPLHSSVLEADRHA